MSLNTRGTEGLRQALRHCERYGMIEERMLVSLDLADTLLILGETAETYRLCKSLVRELRRAGLRTSALRAFDFLRQASLDMALTRQEISYVRAFIERLTWNPALRFLPPPPSSAR